MKLIASLSTLPSRISRIEPVIKSLVDQELPPDEIHLQLPNLCVKEQTAYQIPAFLSKYPKLKVKTREHDYGPATKWLYALYDYCNDENVLVFILDDDCVYDSSCVSRLVDRFKKNPQVGYCFSGGVLPRSPEKVESFIISETPQPNAITVLEKNERDQQVDLLQGFGMFLLFPSWFREANLDFLNAEEIRMLSDDILISSLLQSIGIDRKQLGPYLLPEVLPQAEINPIHGEGRLLKYSLSAISFVKQKMNVWDDIIPGKPKGRSIRAKVYNRLKNLLGM